VHGVNGLSVVGKHCLFIPNSYSCRQARAGET